MAELMDLQPLSLTGDVINAVQKYSADGMDALEAYALSSLGSLDSQQAQELLQGTACVYDNLQTSLQRQLRGWEQFALQTCLQITPGSTMDEEQEDQVLPEFDEAAEAAIDEELASIRQQICEATASRRALLQQANALNAELQTCGSATELAAVASVGLADKENLAEQAAMVADTALRLQPLMTKAAQLQRQHEARALASVASSDAATLAGKEVTRRKAALHSVSLETLQSMQRLVTQQH